MVAGKEVSPNDVKATERLKAYWTHGAGAVKIRWGEPGDFDRCVVELSKYLSPSQVKGYCAERHHDALGYWPSTHAKMERDKKKKGRDKKRG